MNELLQLATDDEGPEEHEQRSVDHARRFLAERGYAEEQLKIIEGCILARFRCSKLGSAPKPPLEEAVRVSRDWGAQNKRRARLGIPSTRALPRRKSQRILEEAGQPAG